MTRLRAPVYGATMPSPRRSEATAEQFAAIADLLGTALFVVDSGGRLLHGNRAGQALLQGPLWALDDGRLRLRNDELGARRLDAALRRALRPARGSEVSIATARGELRQVTVLVLAAPSSDENRPAAAVIVQPTDRLASIALLATSVGLTRAESAALGALASGLASEEIATTLGTSEGAARARLARVRVKAGLPSLAALRALLRGLPPLL